jgi:hypothetical protein
MEIDIRKDLSTDKLIKKNVDAGQLKVVTAGEQYCHGW